MNPQLQNQHSNLAQSLLGAGEVMFGRADGLKRIDLSSAGFWASFWGICLSGLIDSSIYSLMYSSEKFADTGNAPDKLWYVFGNLFISFAGYAASFLLLFLLCRQPNEQQRFPYAVIVNNWASPLASLAAFPVMVLFQNVGESGSGSELGVFVSVIFSVTFLYMSTNILRLSLNIGAGRAFGYMIATVIISIICTDGLKQMVGLSTQ